MHKRLLLIVYLLSVFPAFAQIQDDFSDGDFSNNPVWSGDDTQFKISTTKKLQLNGSGADTSYLSTPSSILSNTVWQFYIKQSFNSSSNNHSRIYLVSDRANLKDTLNGYFVQFGSTQDDICLYRQDGVNVTKIIQGTYGNTGASVNEFTIKVVRDTAANWSLFSDDQAGNNFHAEGTVKDQTYTTTGWFGLWCKYTSSNATKVYFDDVQVAQMVADTIPPKVIDLQVLSRSDLMVYFDEVIDSLSAINPNHFNLSYCGSCMPFNPQWTSAAGDRVLLKGKKPINNIGLVTLVVNDIKDTAGNINPKQYIPFMFYYPEQYDVLINEIMADPSPRVGLPEWEYIELFNRTQIPINLKDFVLQIGSSKKSLPDTIIRPRSFVLVGHKNAAADMAKYGSFIPLSSFSLTNAGQQIILLDSTGKMMHQIKYSDDWYRDEAKKNGGWSLEQISPWIPCGCAPNWIASEAGAGGTPGMINSVYDSLLDNTPPRPERVSVLDSLHVQLFFSEPMDSATLFSPPANYFLETYTIAKNITPDYPAYRSLIVEFAQAMQPRKTYNFVVSGDILDCAGNRIINHTGNYFPIGLPDYPDSNDIIINELLFNPRGSGVDYVEVFNRTEKIVDLKDLRLANWDEEHQSYTNIKELAPDGFQLLPHKYYVLTTDAAIVKKQYYVENPDNMIEIASMISMPNTSGNVILLRSDLKLIDRVDYDEEMQYALLQDPEGISLERLNYDRPSNDRGNWHSAATTGDNYSQASDYAGTPTYKNSQFVSGNEFDGEVWVEPEIFSPDNDGFNDVALIRYKFPEAGYQAHIVIYDAQGREIRNLMANELLGTEGSITWDGLDNDRQKARIGMYVIFVEVFNLNGDTHTYKVTVALAGRL
jgi:hypothetical protein